VRRLGRGMGGFKHGLRTLALKRKRAEIRLWVEFTNMATLRFQALRHYTDAVRKLRAAKRIAAAAGLQGLPALDVPVPPILRARAAARSRAGLRPNQARRASMSSIKPAFACV
jgi:hypothetical protein